MTSTCSPLAGIGRDIRLPQVSVPDLARAAMLIRMDTDHDNKRSRVPGDSGRLRIRAAKCKRDNARDRAIRFHH
jgi:hypothetical protein